MAVLWVVLFLASVRLSAVTGLPIGATPQAYPHESDGQEYWGWGSEGSLYMLPALALVLTAVGLLFGCTWCYQHKDCKIFTASATHLHDARARSQPPDSGFSEPANNNISEDNNNGPISLREMQNIANNNATAYIVSENEERNRINRESVVEFEPLPGVRVLDPLERCADWFAGEDFPRSQLQYLREIGRGWFGRVVEGEIEDGPTSGTVAVKILNQNASLEDKARFLDEARMYRDITHESVLPFIAKCLTEDPWILMFELCSMDLQQYLEANRPKMAILNESGVPLQLMCDVSSGLAHLHARGYLYGTLWSGSVLIRGSESVRAVLGQYTVNEPQHDCFAPEATRQPPAHTTSSEVWSLGYLLWEVCAWGAPPPLTPPPPHLPCPYRNHLYQVMQLCWNPNPESRPTAAQVHALLNHLHTTHSHTETDDQHFEERWQRLKPNTIPKVDEHIAIVHAPSTSTDSQFGSDLEFESAQTIHDSLSVGDTAVSRSSSIMSDKEPLSVQMKSESLNNLHGSFEDVRNIYLTHNEAAALECHQGNIGYEEREQDRSDSSVDPWLKEIIAGSQDDVSYFKDVSDVIKNLDNMLNSEKTSSSESSHQASPSRDNLSLECKKDHPMQTSLVKSPGIRNFQNILEMGFDKATEEEACDDDVDRDTIGTLSHSFERHSDNTSQYTLENITPETPIKDFTTNLFESMNEQNIRISNECKSLPDEELPNDNIEDKEFKVPKLKELTTDETKSVALIQSEGIEKAEAICSSEVSQNRDLNIENTTLNNKHEDINALVNETKSNFATIPDSTSEPLNETLIPQRIENGFAQTSVIGPKDKSYVSDNRLDDTLTPNIYVATDKSNLTDSNCLPKAIIHQTEIFLSNEVEAQQMPIDVDNVKEMVEEKVKEVNEQERPKENIALRDDSSTHLQSLRIELIHDNQENVEKASDFASENVVVTSKAEGISSSSELIVDSVPKDLVNEECISESEKAQDLLEHVGTFTELPDLVQICDSSAVANNKSPMISQLSHEKVQNGNDHIPSDSLGDEFSSVDQITAENGIIPDELSINSTVYMDIEGSAKDVSKVIKDNATDVSTYIENTSFVEEKNESTMYLDLPSVIREMDVFLHSEKILSSAEVEFKDNVHASTPIGSNSSVDNVVVDPEDAPADLEIAPDYNLAIALTKLEQKTVLDTYSPFESPTKSHQTDTYDENSSVVLGPFENCSLEIFKGLKTGSDLVDLPKEELLAFSSNFSEINLETPSPLRDGNFLNEVPDLNDDSQYENVSEPKRGDEAQTDNNTDETEEQSTTEKRVSPSTPPNSPGNILASSSQAYLVDIDLETEPIQNIDINEIEVSQLAIAENENNMNLEYSGPLVEEGLIDSLVMNETVAESVLAGNGRVDETENTAIDAERMKELRNELELKLPLAQVAGIEPASSWTELPPPPELLVTYGALSPIAEETGHQLTAYENDDNWNTSVRTESSESYPEPANNSTDEMTELPTGLASATQPSRDHSTYTIHSHQTYTLHKDATASREITMSADSLNCSPLKKVVEEPTSPINDKTYTKEDDDKESNYERLSQVSPCLISPTTDTSAPDNSDMNAALSTLSKPTLPTDAKSSKPSETQCLSKATSIDSWCSNDTLYNVEENFDDLAMDPDLPLDYEAERDKSESEDTLTHNDDDRELSHTYIIHDSKSEACDTFSPDSITANDNYTYTKVKTGTTPSANTKSDLNDSKNTQTKDLAYGTLGSGMPSFSNCTTELASGFEDTWKLPQPELVRRSPIGDEIIFSPPTQVEEKSISLQNPKMLKPQLNKMDSVDTIFFKDDKEIEHPEVKNNSPNFKGVTNAVTSTPVLETEEDNKDVVPYPLSQMTANTEDISAINISTKESSPNKNNDAIDKLYATPFLERESEMADSKFESFFKSAEIQPQDFSHINNDRLGNAANSASDQKLASPKDSELTEGSLKNYTAFFTSAEIRPQNLSSLTAESKKETFDLDEILDKNVIGELDVDSSPKNVEMHAQLLQPNNICNSDVDEANKVLNSVPVLKGLDTSSKSHTCEMSDDKSIPAIPDDSETSLNSLINFQSFARSAESRPQDISKQDDTNSTEVSDNRQQQSQNGDSLAVSKNALSYSDFENSASVKPQDMHSLNRSNQSDESGVVPDGFRNFEITARERPQDLFSLIDSSSLFLNSERTASERVNCLFSQKIDQPSTSKVEPSVIINPTFSSYTNSPDRDGQPNIFVTDLDMDDENEQPHSIIITETPMLAKMSPNICNISDQNDPNSPTAENTIENTDIDSGLLDYDRLLNKSFVEDLKEPTTKENEETQCNGTNEVFATVHFLNETFEELVESNVDESDVNETNKGNLNVSKKQSSSDGDERVTAVTQDFLQNEKNFCELDAFFPLLSDIRFTGPGSEIMSTSFTHDSPTEPTSPEGERDSTTEKDKPSELLKEWDSDTDSHSTNSSSGEFIWKQRDSGQPSRAEAGESLQEASSVGSGDSGSGSGSEGEEVEFVPSSWDCRAAPAKSSLRSLEQPADGKKRVVFKRQKYHCVYEYPREASDLDVESPAHYLPDFSTYCEWDPRSAEEAEVGYGQLFAAPSPLDMFPLRGGIAFGADYDEDFYITSTARPFELGVLSTSSQFFPGMHLKQSLLPEQDDFPPPPSPLPPLDPSPLPLSQTRTPSLDFTTPDSGVEDITPGSTVDEDIKMTESWKPDSTSSSESVSPSSPGGELGGLRHTRDKLKLDLPPSPHLPSPRHNRVFNFVLDKPKRPAESNTPLVMSDETPIMMALPVSKRDDPIPEPTFSTFGKPTCKSTADSKNIVLTDNAASPEAQQEELISEATENPEISNVPEIIMKADIEEKADKVEPVKGEGTVLDSGDEDSGIESSSKATLERKPANVT
ncbi:unnamed protein product [Leptosia nina]|uniref:Protein kinase domain-containing protein n=1 Tax=Leptosia nina TaxID=320188 RepID=A0AAV1JEH6_9NEOP